jgi:hypothetical protein
MIGLKFRGLPEINIATTVHEVATLKNEYAQDFMDRTRSLDEKQIAAVINQGTMGYAGRNPSPALDADGNFQCTDLDLLSFLTPIAARGAVIEIPQYRNRRQIIRRAGERKIGTNQFGPITSLVSNKDVFSFSVKIHDKTIIAKSLETDTESVGAFRNYMIVDCDGHWYDGWDRIVWDPNAEENAFLKEKKLWTGNSVRFQYYVHPNRWQSVFGAPYLLKKMLLARIDDEAGFYRREMKRLAAAGIELPAGEKLEYKPVVSEGAARSLEVKTMEMALAIPEFTGEYEPVPLTAEGMVKAYRHQKLLTYTWKPAVQFTARADEAAFMRYGLDADDNGRIARWIKDAAWTPWRKNNRSALYNQLVLSDDMALLYRIKTKTEQVSSN